MSCSKSVTTWLIAWRTIFFICSTRGWNKSVRMEVRLNHSQIKIKHFDMVPLVCLPWPCGLSAISWIQLWDGGILECFQGKQNQQQLWYMTGKLKTVGWLFWWLDHLDFHGKCKYDSYLEITHLVRASCWNENCVSKFLFERPRFNP